MKRKRSMGRALGLLVVAVALSAVSGCAGLAAKPGLESAAAVKVGEAAQVVMGQESWKDEADCSAVARLQRTDVAIVVTVDVVDESIRTDEDGTYTNDSVELYFDVRGDEDRGKAFYDQGVFQLILVPAPAGEEIVFAWYQGEGGDPGWATVDGMEATSEMLPKGYRIVVTLPLEGFKENHMAPGKTFNFALGVNDHDDGQDERMQLMSSGTDENWRDPTGFALIAP